MCGTKKDLITGPSALPRKVDKHFITDLADGISFLI